MKQIFSLLALIISYMLCGAQATTLVVDNQTPGWLSSKINYGDQQTVENLTVTGYVNSDDLSFIGTLMQKQKLTETLDLSDVKIVGASQKQDNSIAFDNIFGLKNSVTLDKLLLPTTIHIPVPSTEQPLKYLTVNTLVYGSTECNIFNNSLWGYSGAGGIGARNTPKHLILREGVDSIADYACNSYSGRMESVSFPSTLKFIGKASFKGCKLIKNVNFVSEIEEIGFEAFFDTSFAPDTLNLPAKLTKYFTRSFPVKDGQVVVIPESIMTIDNTYQTYDNMQNTYYKHDHIDRKKYIWVMTAKIPPTVSYYYEGFLENSTVYVPQDSRQAYLNKIPYKFSTIIEIVHPVTGISLNKSALELTEDESEQLTATVIPDNATNKSVNWTSSDVSVAMVSPDGTVYAIKPGQATIMATTVDGGFVAICKVTVKAKVIFAESLTLSTTSANLTVGESIQLRASVSPENTTNKGIRWTSTNTDIAVVSEYGLVCAIKEGDVQIIASTEDGSNLSAICEISVNSRFVSITQVTINPSSVRFAVGETFNLEAQITPVDATNKNINWSSTNPSVVIVDSNGQLTARGIGMATIIASSQDGSNLSATCNVEVFEPTVLISSITIDPTAITGNVGETYRLTATIAPENASDKTLVWSSDNPTAASVDPDGLITLHTKGNAIIKASTIDGSGISASCAVVVDDRSGINDIEIDDNQYVIIYNLKGVLVYKGIYSESNLLSGTYIIISQGNRIKRIIR